MRCPYWIFATFFLAAVAASNASAIAIQTVQVGVPGNSPDTEVMTTDGTTGYGSVASSYRIGSTEVTNAQYVEFLNSVGRVDPFQLYLPVMTTNSWGGIIRDGVSGSYTYSVKPNAIGQGPGGTDYTYADKPVNYVSWYDSLRFVNWLHNGQGNGDTESGAYTLLGGTIIPTNGDAITRNPGARWFLPSENEWYKAAYFDGTTGTYFDYPTGTNNNPNNNLPSADTGNSANFLAGGLTTGNEPYPFTDAGDYSLSSSPFGTFDQGGNVWELHETITAPGMRGVRGGTYDGEGFNLAASHRAIAVSPSGHADNIGFRVASAIPEPSSAALCLVLVALALESRKCRRRASIASEVQSIAVANKAKR
ncbi:formylglycine-generating enzyme family protein [Lacipirellula limnantheis]|uniref:Formylglycine-generating sulfatase enzyme n=1 Tax=Lacipirellula limnantheis TaxID=2528024 RepID=A0A517TV46_9BACT|nr:SUMF1/EgtB/PvdO family nonheme iron enzyme [Lacipirellula limnantheis]QDT72228.1 Formylglycine-generating sulfatase enzyme [Lacipirellula limnantheis]